MSTVIFGVGAHGVSAAQEKDRRIAFFNIHNKETIDLVYMRNGNRLPEAMKKINWIMRDWRRNESTTMSPELIDLLWEIHTELGSREPIHIISGYRSQKTNNMLRNNVGGQAKKSRHILGLAADVHFPDVSVKRLRYSALIRERGGVGYYPTSAIPFVHVDTGRVRHWPRLPRQELALLFPSGKTRHRPASGGPITKRDVKTAKVQYASLAADIAEFQRFRTSPRPPVPVLVAESSIPAFRTTTLAAADRVPPPAPARDANRYQQVASLGPVALRNPGAQGSARPAIPAPAAPSLISSPRLIDRPKPLKVGPSESDRTQLADLFTLASFMPFANLFSSGKTVKGEAARPLTQAESTADTSKPSQSLAREGLAAALNEDRGATGELSSNGQEETARFGFLPPSSSGWVSAPAYDEEHPEELYYRPFPVAPLMTATASPDDAALITMVHPDVASTLDFIDDEGSVLPMQFTPGHQMAAVLWSREFSGSAIKSGQPQGDDRNGTDNSPLPNRSVRTSMR